MIKCTLVFTRRLNIGYEDCDSIDEAIYLANAQLGDCSPFIPKCIVFQKNGELIMTGKQVAALTLDVGWS